MEVITLLSFGDSHPKPGQLHNYSWDHYQEDSVIVISILTIQDIS
jgi:hypothetical protein